MVLPWLPIMAVLFFFTVSRSEVLDCGAEQCVLEAHKGFSTRRDPVIDVRVENDQDTKRPALFIRANGESRFDLGTSTSGAFERYAASRASKTPVQIPVSGAAWSWLLGVILGLEAILIGYYVIAQRVITIEVEMKSGRVRILQRTRARTRELTAFDLGEVVEFELDDENEAALNRAVIAVMKNDDEERRLFEAVNDAAVRGRDFLEESQAKWRAQSA